MAPSAETNIFMVGASNQTLCGFTSAVLDNIINSPMSLADFEQDQS
jgi:hypothetical protein